MVSFSKITVEVMIERPLPAVWNCFTQPEHITKWNFASDDWHCPKASNDLKVGGMYSSRMEAKDGSFGFEFTATYTEVAQQSRLAYTCEDGRSVVTSFEKKSESTKVTTVFDAEKTNSEEMQKSGWQAILNNFKKYTESTMAVPAKNTVCLWFNHDAEDAAQFYAKTFPNSYVQGVHRAPSDNPSGKKGDVLTVEFTIMGIPCIGLNGGSMVTHSEAFSFQISTADQAETDGFWNAIVGNGGQESQCGWCKDKWGVSWQITPAVLIKAVTHKDPAIAKRAFDAMMQMKKIDVAKIEAAIDV
jgi:predicted 3-demethylubiquinone-9 3-methyltransferase (glyoxalase superfamily)/uncharacterized protein YndB with AHSA1/START domain